MTWCLKREDLSPISREEALRIAARWEQEAVDNGIDLDELHAAAGGPLADYLLRTFGEAGDEVEI